MRPPKELYPFESHYFDRNGLKLHYLDEGGGDPVVMVHGNPTWSFYYRNLAKALARTHHVIVPDHIGCGLSDKPDDSKYDYTLASRVDDLDALLTSLNIDRNITLVLHDWGGMIGMAYAARHPERIKRLVLFNTAAFRKPARKKMPWQLTFVRNTPLGAFLVRGFNAFARGAARIGCTRVRLSRALQDAYCAPYDSWANRIATLRFVQDIPLKPTDRAFELVKSTEESLSQFKSLPALICWGDQDFVFDRFFLEDWRVHLPQAEVHQFEDAGHYVLEDAWDEIEGIVKKFFERFPIAAPTPARPVLAP